MTSPLPTIVFLAGAFASPSCFDDLAAQFKRLGYATVYADVPSLNPIDAKDVSTSKDAEHVRHTVLFPLLDTGKYFIVFVHSYGGVVGGAAALGLSKESRIAEGKPGGVIGLLYLVGNIVSEGETLLQAVGGAYPPFIKEIDADKRLAVINPVMETLYNDGDEAIRVKMEEGMIPHSLRAFETPAGAPAWAEPAFDGRRAYVRTLDDQCNPSFLQDLWLQKSGVEWETLNIKSSHCPFVTQTETVVGLCTGVFEKWAHK